MASNFFNKASLVMVPDAPIDGKLPSVKPEDRSGDFTFSRGSNLAATRVNKDGLIEKGRENLLLQSNQFDTTWYNTTSSETGGQIGYDGSNDAWELSISAAAGRLTQLISLGGVQTFSVYAKAGTYNFLDLYAIGNVAHSAYFDLSTGSVGTTFSLIDSSITSVGNGWYKCSITFSDATLNVRFYPAVADNDLTGTSGSIYIQDAQLEQGLVATGYIETTTAAVQKGILENLPRLDYSGGASCPSLLLEPQRSNLITNSEYLGGEFSLDNVSLGYNYGTSPEGVMNSALLTQTGSSSSNSMYEFNLPTTDGSYAYSFFFKAGTSTSVRMYVGTGVPEDFNPQTITAGYSGGTLNILFEDYGNGWWRASATQTLSGAPYNRFSVYPDRGNQGRNVEIWGAQVEVGSYPTSYIPAYSSSVTRSLDSLSKYDFSDSLSQTFFIECGKTGYTGGGGEFILEKSNPVAAIFRLYIEIDNSGTNVSRIRFRTEFPSNNYDFNLGNKDEYKKIALSIDGGNVKLFGNGSLLGTYVVTPTIMEQLNWRVQSSKFSTKQLLLFPTALTDDECIALTTI